MADPDRTTILAMLDRWIRQRPGLDFANYGNVKAYRAEMRSITKDLQHARALLRFVEYHDSVSAERLTQAFQHSYMGRLSLTNTSEGMQGPATWRLDYCTGQYWPTEYRRAACAVLASAIWGWYRDECLTAATERKGEAINAWARREFGRGIGARWFQ